MLTQALHSVVFFLSVTSFIIAILLYGELIIEYEFTLRMRRAKKSD